MTLNLRPATNNATRQLTNITTNATTATTHIETALRRLHDGQAGYPTQPGTGTTNTPDPDHTPNTHPERHALNGTDEATTDTHRLLGALNAATHNLETIRHLTQKWGATHIGHHTNTTPTDSLWCTSCIRGNHFNPRRPDGGTTCRWCTDTLRALNTHRQQHHLPPVETIPIEAIDKHAAGRRVTTNDLTAWAKPTTTTPTTRRPRTQRQATTALREGTR